MRDNILHHPFMQRNRSALLDYRDFLRRGGHACASQFAIHARYISREP